MPAPSGKQGCTRRATTALLLATSRAAVADGATPLLAEPRWAPPTNSPQDDDARYADSTTALSVRSCSITTGRPVNAMVVVRMPYESGSILAAHDQPRPGIRRRSSVGRKGRS